MGGIRKLRRCGGPTRKSLERVRRWSERTSTPESREKAAEEVQEKSPETKNDKGS